MTLLNKSVENRGKVLRDMKNYFEKEKPHLTARKLHYLLLGNEAKNIKGLLYICGQLHDKLHLNCRTGLSLLNTILSIEFA